MNGMLQKYTCRYTVPMPMMLSGVDIRRKAGSDTKNPSTTSTMPLAMATAMTVWTASSSFCRSFSAMPDAMTTFAPTERPTNRLTSRLISGPVAPMPASASLPTSCPATAESTELNSCCSTLVTASGNANAMILPSRGPWSISISCVRERVAGRPCGFADI